MKKQVYNPYLPEGEYIPDGEPHVFGDRVYIYGSHDKCGGIRYCPGDYIVWSAPITDLSDWSNNGVAYKRRGVHNRLGFRCMWAPDCAKGVDGRHYLYYCFDFDNRICVAVSDLPDKDFKFYGYVKHADGTLYGKGNDDIMCFDPAVLVDGERVYLYSGYSANENLRRMLSRRGIKNVDGTGGQVIELNNDMLTVIGNPQMLVPGYKNSKGTGFEGHEMYEASSIRKVGKKYYFIYSTRLSHELAYAISDRPNGGFVYGGALISNGDIGYKDKRERDAVNYWGNIHGSIEQINGKWYVFYHRQTNKTEQSRQGCAEEISTNSDGSIDMVEMTSCGLNGTPLSGEGTYPTYIACHLTGSDGALKCAYGVFSKHKYRKHPCVTEHSKGKQFIKGVRNGSTVGFKYFSIKESSTFEIMTRGDSAKVLVSSQLNGEPFAEIKTEKSRQWKAFKTVTSFTAEKTALYFRFESGGKVDFLSFTIRPSDKV